MKHHQREKKVNKRKKETKKRVFLQTEFENLREIKDFFIKIICITLICVILNSYIKKFREQKGFLYGKEDNKC